MKPIANILQKSLEAFLPKTGIGSELYAPENPYLNSKNALLALLGQKIA